MKRDERKKGNDWSGAPGQLQSLCNDHLVAVNIKDINVFSFICCVKDELISTGLAIQKNPW